MLSINLYAFLMCLLTLVVSINTQRFDYYRSNNYRALSGRAFGEGVLRPGYDQGEGYLTELDAPVFSAPPAASSSYYG